MGCDEIVFALAHDVRSGRFCMNWLKKKQQNVDLKWKFGLITNFSTNDSKRFSVVSPYSPPNWGRVFWVLNSVYSSFLHIKIMWMYLCSFSKNFWSSQGPSPIFLIDIQDRPRIRRRLNRLKTLWKNIHQFDKAQLFVWLTIFFWWSV